MLVSPVIFVIAPALRATRKLFGPEIGFVEVKNPVYF